MLLLINPSPVWSLEDHGFAPMALPEEPKNEEEFIDCKEYRVYPHLGGECFESLYLGTKIELEIREKIILEARKCNPRIKIYQMKVDPNAFKLNDEIIE